jgi:rhodanese-related sulfurtransferase
MKTLGQAAILCALTGVAGLATWKVKGTPDRTIPCEISQLKEGEICLSTVMSEWQNNVVWVDARLRSEWEVNGLPGSILLTTANGENFDQLLEQAVPVLAEGKNVVIYCSDIGCGTSLEIAKRIREFGLAPEVRALHGGWQALQQAGMIPVKP